LFEELIEMLFSSSSFSSQHHQHACILYTLTHSLVHSQDTKYLTDRKLNDCMIQAYIHPVVRCIDLDHLGGVFANG